VDGNDDGGVVGAELVGTGWLLVAGWLLVGG
jgi:hypothetical protein